MTVRVIDYQVPGFRPVRLVTTLDSAISAEEIIALYHDRWEAELAYDELKTVQLAPAKGTLQTPVRSKTPRGVLQETYALLAAYTLMREIIAEAAEANGVAPDKISFTHALHVIRANILRMLGARSEDLPRLHREMLTDLEACLLDRPRRKRRYPRVVKRKIGKYPVKRPSHGALPAIDPVEAFRAHHHKLAVAS